MVVDLYLLRFLVQLKTKIQPVHPKGYQSWVFIGRSDVEAETLILWPPDVKSWLIGKHPDAGKDWGQEEKRTTEEEMVGWHHWPNGHGFEWTLGVGDGQGGLACCGSWGRKELDTTEQLNWTELKILGILELCSVCLNSDPLCRILSSFSHVPFLLAQNFYNLQKFYFSALYIL